MQHTTPDDRYTVTAEWTGQPTRQYVARFCGEWIGSSWSEAEAYAITHRHNTNRMKLSADLREAAMRHNITFNT